MFHFDSYSEVFDCGQTQECSYCFFDNDMNSFPFIIYGTCICTKGDYIYIRKEDDIIATFPMNQVHCITRCYPLFTGKPVIVYNGGRVLCDVL